MCGGQILVNMLTGAYTILFYTVFINGRKLRRSLCASKRLDIVTVYEILFSYLNWIWRMHCARRSWLETVILLTDSGWDRDDGRRKNERVLCVRESVSVL